MSKIKNIIRKIPILKSIFIKFKIIKSKLISTEKVFTNIYKNNGWGDSKSVSGTGSNLTQTKVISEEILNVFKEFNISSVLDIPCGDFHWMSKVDLSNIKYIGADIVKDIVDKNNKDYSKENISFKKLDLIKDELPKVDLIICRDCLVHLSLKDIFLSLKNIKSSNSVYLLTTTFTDHKINADIITGEWRTLNLFESPFNLSQPIKIINEQCSEDNNKYMDKSLVLWKISDIIIN